MNVRADLREEICLPGDPALDARYETLGGRQPWGGVVVAHPHPLHGGTMANPVVHHVAKACRGRDLASLRFDFRGVGQSGGRFDGLKERQDVSRAAAYLRGRLPGRPVGLAGYSFGAVMSALAVAEGEPADALALVAFAIAWDEFMPAFFDPLAAYRGPVLAVCGERDDISPPDEVGGFLAGLGLDLEMVVIPGADHYFGGRTREVGEAVGRFLEQALVRSVEA